MYQETIDGFSRQARNKVLAMKKHPWALAVGAILAGAYVGLGIILILSIGSNLPESFQPLVMGLTFSIALTLVVFAGSELFTGHTMYMTFGFLKKEVTWQSVIKIWLWVWGFNLIGSLLLVLLYSLSQGQLVVSNSELLLKIADKKMNATILELFIRGIFCNWLVCLALWMCARTQSDAAKCILIFWCLLGFIASGYEHSVANMTLLSLALFAEHPEMVSWWGMAYNLLWVSLGNIIGGVVFVGMGYWMSSYGEAKRSKKIKISPHPREKELTRRKSMYQNI